MTEEEDRFYLRRTVKANPRVPAEYSMTAAELDALCAWWAKKIEEGRAQEDEGE